MSDVSNLHVIVVGGGLGGLALAQGLLRAGVSVAVYERDASPEIRNQGYRIRLNSDGIAALKAVLAPEAFEVFAATAGMPGSRMDTLDHHLTPLHSYSLPPIPGEPGDGHLAVNRMTLRQILLAGLGDSVHFGARFTHFTQGAHSAHGARDAYDTDPAAGRPSPVTAHFADGSTATGDLLVGADGVNSATRQQALPHNQVVDAGLRLLYGKVPFAGREARAQVPGELLGLWTTVVGPGKRFVGLAPVQYREPMEQVTARLAPDIRLTPDSDYLTCVFGARQEQFPCTDEELFAKTGQELRDLALSLTQDWHPVVRQIVSSQAPASIFPVSVRTSVPAAPWPTTAVTLLGDAVHAMSPAIGVGANTALRDARTLAACLAEAAAGRPLLEAVHAYEDDMIGYGFDAVRESAKRGHDLVGQNPLPVTGI